MSSSGNELQFCCSWRGFSELTWEIPRESGFDSSDYSAVHRFMLRQPGLQIIDGYDLDWPYYRVTFGSVSGGTRVDGWVSLAGSTELRSKINVFWVAERAKEENLAREIQITQEAVNRFLLQQQTLPQPACTAVAEKPTKKRSCSAKVNSHALQQAVVATLQSADELCVERAIQSTAIFPEHAFDDDNSELDISSLSDDDCMRILSFFAPGGGHSLNPLTPVITATSPEASYERECVNCKRQKVMPKSASCSSAVAVATLDDRDNIESSDDSASDSSCSSSDSVGYESAVDIPPVPVPQDKSSVKFDSPIENIMYFDKREAVERLHETWQTRQRPFRHL